jgi:hypothetical protein
MEEGRWKKEDGRRKITLTKDERHCAKRCVVSKIGKGREGKEGELASGGRLFCRVKSRALCFQRPRRYRQ